MPVKPGENEILNIFENAMKSVGYNNDLIHRIEFIYQELSLPKLNTVIKYF